MLLGALALSCACAFGEETKELGVKDGAPGAAARKLLTCGFLLNKDFKENAKYYLCLFSASWCGPCRREMPRIAKTYAESLKADPNIELIHFSRDNDENKALAWAKEHDVKFPVVKYNGGNPLDLHSRGIPHLFIVDADGKLIEEGHPAKLFTDEKLNALKAGEPTEPETVTEKTRNAIAKLFPGWSLDSEVPQGGRQPEHSSGFHASHRGRNNIIRLHPMNRETPVVLSRMVKLPDNNPCLALCVSSWNDDADFLLSVRVNGKDALTNRLVCTPDAVPWEDIVVPLSPWRGSSVKLEIILSANNWWCEWSHLARVDIIEADGDMRINEGKWEVDGYTWSYRAQNGEATIVAENDGRFSAVSPCPVGSITIPATIAGAKVTHIGRDAFLDCSALTSVTIPEGVSRIGRGAFHDCTGLKSIKMPSSVKIIERDAFLGCNALSSVSIPEGVTSIERGTFDWCCGLESIEIPSGVTQIGGSAFAWCKGLTSVTIPERVTDIGDSAFHGCNALTSVTISASVTNINHVAFRNTGALTTFQVDPDNRFYKSENGLLLTKDGTMLVRGVNGDATIPPSVTAIGPCAFEGCVALRSAEIPSGVKSIGSFAFKQCRGMKSVTIPPSVTDIEREAFHNCKGLKSIAIPQGVTVIRNSTFTGSSLTEVVIPANVKVLERGAFSWCGELKSVTFPEGMTIIGRDAFYSCGKLTTLVIPSSVQRIEQGAFYGCGSLTSVTMRGERPNVPNNIFDRCGNLKAIHVPANAKSWAGMKEWFGIPLVFDGEQAAAKLLPESLSVGLEGALVGYWTFDGNANDATMNRNNGTLHGVTQAEDRYGNVNKAYRFNGSSYIEVPHSETLNMTHAITMTAWIKPQSWWANQWIVVMQKGDQRNVNYQFAMRISDNRVFLCNYGISQRCGQLGLELDKWQQVALTYESGKNLCFYRNGVLIGTWQFAKDLQPNKGSLLIGYDPFWGTEYFIGDMDDVRLFNRALSEEEIKALYKAEVPTAGKEIVDGIESKAEDSWNSAQDVEYKFNYKLDDKGNAILTGVSPKPEGALVCPNIIEGHKVTGIGRGAFNGCDKMTKIMLPEHLETLPVWVSGWCIHGSIFYGCTALSSIGISETNPKFASVDGALYSKDKKVLFAYPKDRTEIKVCRETTSIQGDAFHSSLLFKKINIPEGISYTGGFAFSACPNLEEVIFPKEFGSINHHAFFGCPKMKKVVFLGDAPEAYWRRTASRENVFYGAARDIVVCVRKGSKGWNGKDSTDLPGRWPLDGSDSRPIRYIDEAAEKMNDAFSLNVAPGSVTELDLGNVPPLQFVYCPAGKFSMGYKDQPALSKVKDVEITSPFWVSKTPIRADQLEFMGLNSNTNAETGDAVINDGSIVLEKLPSALKERFGKMLPPGYVFRLPTEAEFEYLQKSEMNDKNAQTNIWGVERLYSGGLVALLDKAPAYGRVDVVRRRNHRGVIMTDLVKVNYENQPDKDPVGWTDDPTWSVFRRGLARNCGGGKLVTAPGGGKYHYSFYFVVAPDVDKLNKFYWK